MIINVTDKEKSIIESYGYMVVQYKKFCMDVEPILNRFVHHVVDGMEKLILFFQQMLFKNIDEMQPVFDWQNTLGKELQYIPDQYRYVHIFLKTVPFCKDICKKYNRNFIHKVIYHRCRDRC